MEDADKPRILVKFCSIYECSKVETTLYQTEREYNDAWEEIANDWYCELHQGDAIVPPATG